VKNLHKIIITNFNNHPSSHFVSFHSMHFILVKPPSSSPPTPTTPQLLQLYQDFTSYFSDLSYWSPLQHLHLLHPPQVLRNIDSALITLITQGYTPIHSPTATDSSDVNGQQWLYGIDRSGLRPLPVDQRIKILMFHLRQLREEVSGYPRDWICHWVDSKEVDLRSGE